MPPPPIRRRDVVDEVKIRDRGAEAGPSICSSITLTIEEGTPFLGWELRGKLKTPRSRRPRAYDVTQRGMGPIEAAVL